MDKVLLRKVQLVQLEILKEIDRVCEENGIRYFLDFGTLLGAIRHKGFIPWDDDLDIGMMREDYDRFCQIAGEKLSSGYSFQSWLNDPEYPLPYGKVRKNGTLYLENKGHRIRNNGFYVDIFPYDYAPAGEAERSKLAVKLTKLSREILMKCHFTPWAEENRIHLGKRIGYLYYQIKTIFRTREELIRDYEGLIRAVPKDPVVYTQCAWKHVYYFEKCWFDGNRKETFEDGEFPVPVEAEKCLKAAYGDYMTPPPEDQRENRHQILEIDFGA